MLIAPADSPKTVTLSGISAEPSDVLPHPLQGGDLVQQPDVGTPSPRKRKPSAPGRQLITTQTTPSRAKCPPSYAAVELSSNMPPWIHTITGNPVAPRIGRPDIQVQTVLGGRSAIHRRERAGDVRPILTRSRPRAAGGRRRHLRRLRTRPGRVPHTAPRLDRHRRTKPVRTERRGRVRNPQERIHTPGDTALQLPSHRLDHRIHAHHRSTTQHVTERGQSPGTPTSTSPKIGATDVD